MKGSTHRLHHLHPAFGDYRFRADKDGAQYWSDTENHCTLPGCTNAVITTTVQAELLGRGKTFAAPLPWAWNTASLPNTTIPASLYDNANAELVTRTITYTYDPLNRLTAADYSTGESYAYQYDSVGNRTAYTLTTPLDGTAVTTYTYDAANRLLVAGAPGHAVAYTWDARGNLLSNGTFTYTYSAAGRMVRAESITATLVYTYNADGLRVARSQSVSSVESVDTFTWDWATPVPELLSDGESLYLIGYDTLGWQRGNDWVFALPDALGSVRQETDATGAVTAVREWSPYGEEVGGAQAGLGFTGEWFDAAVGLQYLRARWYQPGTGRFTQADPWEGDDGRPQSLNGWTYVEGNPIRLVDPSGLTWDAETQASVRRYKDYFLQSAARHNAIPAMDQNGFAGLIASTMANERRMGNMPRDDRYRNPFMQYVEDRSISLGCIVSGSFLSRVCDPRNNDTFDLQQCLRYFFNEIPETEPLFALASVGIGNIKLATAARLWKGLNRHTGPDAPPVTVSPLQYDRDLFFGSSTMTINISNPFDSRYPFASGCTSGACDYDPSTNTAAYQILARQLLDPQMNIEYAAALLEEGALMTLNAGEQPSAFASVMWYKHSAATHEEIRKRGAYADLGYILADVNQALDVWGLSTIWDRHSWDMEPHYHQYLMRKAWEQQYAP